MDNKLSLRVVMIAIMIIAIGGYFFPQAQNLFGAVANRLPHGYWDTADGYYVDGTAIIDGTGNLVIGSSGTSIDRINTGTCYIRPYAATIAASSTAKVDCQATAAWSASGVSALSGVSNGDNVVVTLGTTTVGTTFGGVVLAGASASTTAGFIELTLSNFTGAAFTWPVTGVASGTAAFIATDL